MLISRNCGHTETTVCFVIIVPVDIPDKNGVTKSPSFEGGKLGINCADHFYLKEKKN